MIYFKYHPQTSSFEWASANLNSHVNYPPKIANFFAILTPQMGFFGAQIGSNLKPHWFEVERGPFRPVADQRSVYKWVFEVCKTHTSKPVTQDLFGSGSTEAYLLGGRSMGMGDDICEISSPNSRPCASKVRTYFRTLRNTPPWSHFLGVFYPKKG